MPESDPIERIRALLAEQRFGVLATLREEAPYPTLVAFAPTADLRELLFVTSRSTRKFANLRASRQAALLVDDRTNAPGAYMEATAVTALGRARILEGTERRKRLPLFLERHPSLEGFASAPSTALVRVRVARYQLIYRFQNVLEVPMP